MCSDHGTQQSYHSLPCAKATAHSKDLAFAVCIDLGTRQRASLCRVPGRGSPWQRTLPCHPSGRAQKFAVGQVWHTGKALPCARNIAHGKGCLCRWLFAVCPLPCAAHGKAFAVCGTRQSLCRVQHMANKASPVVIDKTNVLNYRPCQSPTSYPCDKIEQLYGFLEKNGFQEKKEKLMCLLRAEELALKLSWRKKE